MGTMEYHQEKQSVLYWTPWEGMEKGPDSLFKEIVTENFPNLGRYLDIQFHETH